MVAFLVLPSDQTSKRVSFEKPLPHMFERQACFKCRVALPHRKELLELRQGHAPVAGIRLHRRLAVHTSRIRQPNPIFFGDESNNNFQPFFSNILTVFRGCLKKPIHGEYCKHCNHYGKAELALTTLHSGTLQVLFDAKSDEIGIFLEQLIPCMG